MKRTGKIIACLLAFVIVCGGVSAILYMTPKTFLKGVSPSEVSRIGVFDGTNGRGFSVKESEDIERIVTAVQSVKMKRNGISTGYSGFALRLAFVDENGNIIDNFILNSDTVIRDDPFFYEGEGSLGFGFIKGLEEEYINKGEA